MNSIKEYIESMPITVFHRVGSDEDWQEPGSLENKADIRLLTNPKSVELIHKKICRH